MTCTIVSSNASFRRQRKPPTNLIFSIKIVFLCNIICIYIYDETLALNLKPIKRMNKKKVTQTMTGECLFNNILNIERDRSLCLNI